MPANYSGKSQPLKINMKNKESILVIIAARGGSKGLKNKNIKLLMGKPLIAHTILQAKKWGRATTIVCSTDSKKIAKLSERYGADVPFMRPKYLAGDKVAKTEVLRHALIKCENIYNKVYDIIVDLDVTSPIRKISDLDKCLRLFKKRRPKTLFSVTRSRRNPYFNMVEERRGGRVSLCKTAGKRVFARQDAPPVYDMNASIYFYSRKYLIDIKDSTAISDNSCIYVMDEISRFDIDSVLDFKFIEFLMKERIWNNEVR